MELQLLPEILFFGRKCPWLLADFSLWGICIQEVIHEGIKRSYSRRRLNKPELILPFGNKIASIADVIHLMSCVSKDVHLLHEADVNLYEKMNYKAVARLTRPEIDELLRLHCAGF